MDAADDTAWRDHLGQIFTLTGENLAAATPGLVDAEDYAFWKANFGASAGDSALASNAVPEPPSIGLLLLLIVGVFAATLRQEIGVSAKR